MPQLAPEMAARPRRRRAGHPRGRPRRGHAAVTEAARQSRCERSGKLRFGTGSFTGARRFGEARRSWRRPAGYRLASVPRRDRIGGGAGIGGGALGRRRRECRHRDRASAGNRIRRGRHGIGEVWRRMVEVRDRVGAGASPVFRRASAGMSGLSRLPAKTRRILGCVSRRAQIATVINPRDAAAAGSAALATPQCDVPVAAKRPSKGRGPEADVRWQRCAPGNSDSL